MDDEGHIIAVWDSDDNRVKNSLLSFNTLSWSSPSAISSESSSVPFNPILKVNSEGFAVVVWSYFNGTDFLVQALTTVNPPLALAGIKKQNRFAFSSYFLTELEWRKSPSPLVYYQIYCNGAPIARISNQQIRYLIPFVLSKEKITYSITSISSSDVESPPISVTP
jgi:hypothetical protein